MDCSKLLDSYIFGALNGVLFGLISSFLWIRIGEAIKTMTKLHQMVGLCLFSTIKIAVIGICAVALLRCGTINFILFLGCFFVTSTISAWRAI